MLSPSSPAFDKALAANSPSLDTPDEKMAETKCVLVTGASGFIGRALIPVLIGAGYTVRAAVRRPVSFPMPVDVVVVPEFSRPVDLNPILRGVNIVIHAAGRAHADVSDDAHGVFDRVNRLLTQRLADAAVDAGVERFLFISSVRAQVGPSATRVVREQDEPHPTDPYGCSKLAGELAIRSAGVPYTILRPVAVYGPHAKGHIHSGGSKIGAQFLASTTLFPQFFSC